MPWEHIEKAARRAGIDPADIAAEVAALNEHLGWDITRGARASRDEES